MSYAERRKGKLSGRWLGEEIVRGKRFKRAFATKAEADGYEAYVKATGEEPPHKDGGKHTGVTFREIAELCKQAGGPRRARWKNNRDASVHQRLDHVVTLIGDLDIAAVGTLQLDGVVRDLQKRPGTKDRALSAATINRYLTAASAVLTFASQRGYIQGKPVIPLQEEDGAREAVVSPDMEAAMLKWMVENEHPMEALCCLVLVETGLRAGELHGLEPEQITNEWIKLRASQVKTKRAREVYIRPELAKDFRAMIASGQRPKAFHLRRIFKQAAKACGDSGELVVHSLRHTRATRLLENGVDPQITMEMLGWTSFATMTRYRHVNSSMHAEAAKKVARAGGGSTENGQVIPFSSVRSA